MQQQLKTLLADMNLGLVDREQAVKAAVLTVLAAENLVLIGPPGTAKSMVSRRLAQHIQTLGPTAPAHQRLDAPTPRAAAGHALSLDHSGHGIDHSPDEGYFEYLLTKFSTPEEIFGPLSISELKADRFRRNTAGYLPTAQVAFLDEIFKASSSILNALLTILNERIFHNGNQPQRVPLRSLVAASNELPSGQDELSALYDRFLMRIFVGPVPDDQLHRLFATPDAAHQATALLTQRDLQAVDAAAQQVAIPPEVGQAIRGIWAAHKEAFKEDRRETLSDRRLVKLLKLLRVSAATNQRQAVDFSDAMLLQHCLWNHPDNMDKVRDLVVSTLQRHSHLVPMAADAAQTHGGQAVYEVGADGKQLVQHGVGPPSAPTQQTAQKSATPQPASNCPAEYIQTQPATSRSRKKGFQGCGTAQDPLRIASAEDLISLDDPDIGQAGLHFLQTADIDCANTTHWPQIRFKGHYHGNNKTIRNPKGGCLFSHLLPSSSVTQLRLQDCLLATHVANSQMTHCHGSGARLAHVASDNTDISDCHVSDDFLLIEAKNTRIIRCQVVAGWSLVGTATDTHISDCAVLDASLNPSSSTLEIGLIATTLSGQSVIERCYCDGDFSKLVTHNTLSGAGSFSGAFGGNWTGPIQSIGIASADSTGIIRQCAVGPLNAVNTGVSARIAPPGTLPVWVSLSGNSAESLTLQNNASIDTNPGTDDANGKDGKTVAAARFNQRFFEGQLGWDFDTVWQWDGAHQRPALRPRNAHTTAPTAAAHAGQNDLLARQVQANIWL